MHQWAGALVSARVGSSMLPQEFIEQLENKELKDDAIKAALLLV